MHRNYFNPSLPSSFGGVEPLFQSVKNVTRNQVKDFLRGQEAYTLHKQRNKKFKRLKTIAYGLNRHFQTDLADFSNIQKYNKGFKFVLIVIDVLSRYTWAVPLKSKKGSEVAEALDKIFKERTPIYLNSDKGTEYYNRNVAAILKKHDVIHFSAESEIKAAMAERVIKNLKTRLYRYFTFKNTYCYLDVLAKFIKSYNNSKHSALPNLAPSQVTMKNELKVWRHLYKRVKVPPLAKSIKAGDFVLITRSKDRYEKGYERNYSREVFKVVRAKAGVYTLQDLQGTEIKGRFYKQEVQKIIHDPEAFFPVEKVIKRVRGRALVKFLGYPSSFNKWIPTSQIKKIST